MELKIPVHSIIIMNEDREDDKIIMSTVRTIKEIYELIEDHEDDILAEKVHELRHELRNEYPD